MSWTIIDGYPNYAVSTSGFVKNVTTGRILKPGLDGRGYEYVGLHSPGKKQKSKKVHVLVGNAFIPNPSNKKCLDHINGDKRDNRAENLRWASTSENGVNVAKYKGNTSCYSVSWAKGRGKWRAQIMKDGKTHYLGYFETAEEAAATYDRAALEMFGEFARINMPQTPKSKIPVAITVKPDYVAAATET